MRLKKLRQLAAQIQQEVKDISDSQVTIQILRTSRVGKEAVKTVKVMQKCHGTIRATVDKWKECLSKGPEQKKVKLDQISIIKSVSHDNLLSERTIIIASHDVCPRVFAQ